MNTKDAYRQKIEAELELVKAELELLKAKAKVLSADANLQFVKELKVIEDQYSVVKSKLHELGKAGESTWEDLKVETEIAWDLLSANVRSAINKFK